MIIVVSQLRGEVMEAELREVLTPTPELLERAQRAQVAWLGEEGGRIGEVFLRDFLRFLGIF